MKRIVFTVINDLTYDQRMQRIATSLAEAGYSVTLVGRELQNSKPLSNKPYKQTRIKCFFNQGKVFYLEFNLRLFFLLLKTRFDIAGAVDLDTILPCYLNVKIKGGKFTYDAHEYFSQVPEVVHRPLVRKTWEFLEKQTIPHADLCYTVSSSISNVFSEKYPKHFYILRNIPALNSTKTRKFNEPVVMYQGALNKGRGLEQLIESAPDLPVQIWIAGEGDLSGQLREYSENFNTKNNIRFLGKVTPEKLREITPRAFVGYNLMEKDGLSYYYSLSNKFFDYIHAGVPSLSSNFPEYKELNEEYEVAYLTELSSDNIKTAIDYLLTHKAHYNQLVKNCESARKNLNWQKESEKLISLYKKL